MEYEQSLDVEEMIVDCNVGFGPSFTVLDLGRFARLRVFEVGDNCFSYVETVKLVGLPQLERVRIGTSCFSRSKNNYGNPIGSFCLIDCPRVRELSIGLESFVGYALCEIANDPCLEVVKVGVLAEPGWSFHQGTLRMRSVFTWLYSSADLSKLKTLLIGSEVLKKYTSAVFESEFLRGD